MKPARLRRVNVKIAVGPQGIGVWALAGRRHQGSGPSFPTNVPVGPSVLTVAIVTRIATASSTVVPPARRNASRSTESVGRPVNSVSAKPGVTELTRQRGKARAYWTVSMFSAAFGIG